MARSHRAGEPFAKMRLATLLRTRTDVAPASRRVRRAVAGDRRLRRPVWHSDVHFV